MTLADRVHVARRFQRSIRIDTDLRDARALEGFVCPQSFADVLLTMARHVRESGQGAFTWTGPYGGGKSSLVVALSGLLSGNAVLQAHAAHLFGRKVTAEIRETFPSGKSGWRIVPVVARRDHPLAAIGEAMESVLGVRRPRAGWDEKRLLGLITETAARAPKTRGGLILFIDEMGKFLEAAAHESADLHILQELAEAASRSGGRFLVVGILHQAFDEYAQRLSHEKRDEWAKIQGRYVDLALNTAGEEQIDLLSRAIRSAHRPKGPGKLSGEVALIVRRERPADAKKLAELLDRCWPLHSVVTCLLGPISRRRFGQNQRSLFGFLNSSEPHGFQDFLRTAHDNDLYDVETLWDYLRANLEPSILASPDGHRWALAVEAVERSESISTDRAPVPLLKTIALIDLFKERSGLVASERLLRACMPSVTHSGLAKALAFLQSHKLVLYRKFQDAYAVFAGSDFDIDQAVRQAMEDTTELDFTALNALAGLQPLLAKRHYHDTGAMRWFDVRLTPLRSLSVFMPDEKEGAGTVGRFLLAIPTDGERKDYAERLCREAARHSDKQDVIVGMSTHSFALGSLGRELLALEAVRNDRPELAGDPVARREVSARLASVQAQFEGELRKALDSAVWYRKSQRGPKPYRQADLSSLASTLAAKRFDKSPKLHNELLNRQRPSGSAIAAQNELLRRMVLNEGQERLGITGFPAEGGLFASILEATGLYRHDGDGWRFLPPADADDSYRLFPMWDAASKHLREHGSRTATVSGVYDLWRQQPLGVKDGLMPVLAVAFILSQRNKLAVYREGVFRARFDDVDVQYLAKDPAMIQLRWMDLSDVSRRLLSDMADIVRSLDQRNSLAHLEAIDVARGLVGIYDTLPPWTKRTMRLSANAVRVRELFRSARDPNQFLFDDIPGKLGGANTAEVDLARVVVSVREGLEELTQTYPSMLHRLRDTMLAELQVPNLSPGSLAELRARAENIRQLVGDFYLDAYINRLAEFDASDGAFEGIASLAADKPPRDWVDPDLDRSAINIADMAQRFLRAETFARVKGRPEKRHAMAVVIGMNGRPVPLLEEFEVADSDRVEIDELIDRVAATLEESDKARRKIILAALTELSARYIRNGEGSAPRRTRKGGAA